MITENKLFKKIIFLAILFLTLSFNSALANLNDGLIGYWSFDNSDGTDFSGNGNDAIVHGSKYVEGIKGNAIYFENANNGGWYDVKDYVTLPNVTLNDFSVSLWTKFYSANNYDPLGDLVSFGDHTVGSFFSMFVNTTNGQSYILIKSSYGDYYVTTNYNLNDNNWHNIIVTKGLDKLNLYLDKSLISTINLRENISFVNSPAYLGYHQWSGGLASSSRYYGIVDELKIYNRVLDASDINSLYLNLTEPNSPTNLKQYVKSPELEEEEITIGTKIGKFQSGSGIILKADTDSNELSKLVVDIYKIGESSPARFTSDLSISQSKEIIIPYLGVGDYYWQAMIENKDGLISDAVDFGNNSSDETDFSLFEGFEPYPYGYSFVNASPDYNLLTGKITGFNILNSRKKEDGTKWEIMDMVFPLKTFNGDEREYFAAFETLGLNNKYPSIFNGNCFGLALSSLTHYNKPEILKNSFSSFSNNIGDGYIFDKIKIENDKNNLYKWIGLNDNIKSILALQLYQKETSFDNKMNFSYKNDTPVDILNKVKNNPGKYILSIKGKFECNMFGFGCKEIGHAVVPYKVEGNKIYIWDNNVPFPFFTINEETKFAYNQYIEIDTINNKYSVSGYNRDKYEKIGIVSIDEAFTDNTSVIGFNDTDTLYTLNGNSDILLTDSNGNKTGYKNGETYEEIPGTRIIVNYTGDTTDNTWKQIYLPQKLENLKIEINGKTEENYDLMIAGGDYYTKIEGINTSSGQIDTFNISRENIKLDLDDNKIGTGAYDILVDDFQNNGNGTVYIQQIEEQKGIQTLDINWTNVVNNSSNAVIYQADTNNDGIIDISKNTKAIDNPQDINDKKSSISGKINILEDYSIGKKIDKLKYIDIILMLEKEKDKKSKKDNKNKLKEILTKRHLIKIKEDGSFKLDNLELGKYKLEIVNDNIMNKVLKPETGYYELEIKDGFDYINRDFDIIKGYKLKELKEKLNNLKHK